MTIANENAQNTTVVKREQREGIARKRESKRSRCGRKKKEKTGKEKGAWKRKRMRKVFARFDYYAFV